MNKYRFSDIFQENPDGSLSPRVRMRVNGIEFGPGMSFSPGTSLGGIDFFQYKNLDIAADIDNEILVLRGFYRQ